MYILMVFQGLIRIHVIDAENLAEKDAKIFGLGGKSDPFVVVKGTLRFYPLSLNSFA